MKKLICIILALCALFLSSCGEGEPPPKTEEPKKDEWVTPNDYMDERFIYMGIKRYDTEERVSTALCPDPLCDHGESCVMKNAGDIVLITEKYIYFRSTFMAKKYTRYGLISKSNNPCKTLLRNKSRIKYLEFVFDSDGYPSVSDILLAAEHCSMKLRRIDTLSPASSRTQKTPLICPVFRVESADLNTFLTFLSIDCPGFKSLGIYTQI